MRAALERTRVRMLGCAVLGAMLAASGIAATAPAARTGAAALREMQVYKLHELGLEVWVENQPPWTTTLSMQAGHPTFVAQSPDNYHPPAVMTFASWPQARTADMRDVALTAIRRASRNFGLNLGQARGIQVLPASYGVLQGYEALFDGSADGTAMDVIIFVGQAPGKFPVALTIYTMRGKMDSLAEQRRRSWTKLAYL
jgi:hypothetical protein